MITSDLSYFDASIAKNVPDMLRYLCMIWVGLILASCILISRPKKDPEVDDQEAENYE